MGNIRVYVAVITIRAIYAGMQVITKIAFNQGMSTYVFVFYRQAFGTLLLAPLALLLERKAAPPMSRLLFFKIFAVSLFAITGSLTTYNIALDYTSPTLASALINVIPVVTFVLAVLLRVETVEPKKLSGIAKVLGVALCVAGVATIAFYRGPYIKPPIHHHYRRRSSRPGRGLVRAESRETWVLGTFIMITSNALWSLWIISQGFLLKEYPSMLLLNTLQSVFSTIQSFSVALAVERDLGKWKLGFDMGLFSAAYSGIVVTAISFYLQSWCIQQRGPVFLATSTPLTLVITIAISLFILGETINLQSILGGILMVGGLYCVLLGKSRERVAGDDVLKVEGGIRCVEEMHTERSLSSDAEVC